MDLIPGQLPARRPRLPSNASEVSTSPGPAQSSVEPPDATARRKVDMTSKGRKMWTDFKAAVHVASAIGGGSMSSVLSETAATGGATSIESEACAARALVCSGGKPRFDVRVVVQSKATHIQRRGATTRDCTTPERAV